MLDIPGLRSSVMSRIDTPSELDRPTRARRSAGAGRSRSSPLCCLRRRCGPASWSGSSLLDRLSEPSDAPVVAAVAPPGYGKTTLLATWAERDPRSFAWLTLDRGANDPAVLLTYLVFALDTVIAVDPAAFDGLAAPHAIRRSERTSSARRFGRVRNGTHRRRGRRRSSPARSGGDRHSSARSWITSLLGRDSHVRVAGSRHCLSPDGVPRERSSRSGYLTSGSISRERESC